MKILTFFLLCFLTLPLFAGECPVAYRQMAKKELSAQAKTHRVGAMRVHKRLRATPLAAQASRLMDMLAIIGLLLLCAVCLFFTVFFIVNFVWYSLILLPIFLAGSILGGLFGYFLLQGVPC